MYFHTKNHELIGIPAMLVGSIFFAFIFGQMVVTLSNMTRTRDAFAIRCAGINEAMIQQALPQTMQTRVRRFYEYIWLYERGRSDAMKYVREVPAGLRSDIMCSQYALFLTKVPLFAGCKSDVIARLAERLVPHLFLLDELIVREGSPGGEMYFIERGLVRVVKGKNIVICHLKQVRAETAAANQECSRLNRHACRRCLHHPPPTDPTGRFLRRTCARLRRHWAAHVLRCGADRVQPAGWPPWAPNPRD